MGSFVDVLCIFSRMFLVYMTLLTGGRGGTYCRDHWCNGGALWSNNFIAKFDTYKDKEKKYSSFHYILYVYYTHIYSLEMFLLVSKISLSSDVPKTSWIVFHSLLCWFYLLYCTPQYCRSSIPLPSSWVITSFLSSLNPVEMLAIPSVYLLSSHPF